MKNFWVSTLVFIMLGVLVYISLIDVVLASDGFVAYRSNSGIDGLNSPKIRYWNNTNNTGNGSFSEEIELPSANSPVVQLILKQSPISSKIVMVTTTADANLSGYVCMHECTNVSNWNFTTDIARVVFGALTINNTRRFDLSFETATGDLLLVYGVNDSNAARDLAYKVLPENTTSFQGLTEQYINDGGHATNLVYEWTEMDSDPLNTSEEIIMGGFDDTDNHFNAWIWNGSGFGFNYSITNAATTTTNREAHAVKYASDGSKAMVASGDQANGNLSSAYWNGTGWTRIPVFDINPANGNDINWLSMKADPVGEDLQLVIQDSGSDLLTSYWNGTTWTLTAVIDPGVDIATSRVSDFSWVPSGGTGRLVWDTDAAGTNINQTLCNPICNATGWKPVSTYAGTGAWMTLFRNPTASDLVKFLGFRLNNAFDIGALRFNGTNYTNYGDAIITADTTVTAYEAFSFDYRRDMRPPSITFITPNSSNIVFWTSSTLFFNITSNEYLPYLILNWNGTNYTMDGSDMNWNYTFTNLNEGFYSYKVYATDWAGNMNITETRNITINFPPNITIVNPQNNTLNNYSRNTTFYYNVTDISDNVSSCSLIIDNVIVLNTTINPVNETKTNNFTYTMGLGQHNWSISCMDTNNLSSISENYNITGVAIKPVMYSIYLDDNLVPYGEVMLNAGSTRFVNCSVVVSDPDGPEYINNITAKFYYYLNVSNDPDNNNTHYTNGNCTLINATILNKTFVCGFDVLYYANNGTWVCNMTVNNYPYISYYNLSTLIQPLYAVNLTDGITFDNVSAGFPSNNVTVNITNFGNMPVNVTLQGYALVIGDNVGMNCSDATNINITNIRFSTNNTASFAQKIQMNGAIQPLNFKIAKQITSAPVFNTTYWQVNPDPGTANRICTGYVIFSAEAS